jgi:CubicO group peptidase (beta-lactamase class C family)
MEIRPYPDRSAELDNIAAQSLHGTGLVIAVLVEGKPVHVAGYGVANRETKQPATPETPFHMASCGKQFTGVGIMMLKEAGKLQYDDHIGAHVPELAGFPPNVTLRRLLHHTSGVYDFYGDAQCEGVLRSCSAAPRNTDLITLYRQIDFAMSDTVGYEAYSNAGYDLLGLVIERVSGMSYPDFFRQRVFDPLGMANSFSVPNAARLASGQCAVGYEKGWFSFGKVGGHLLDGMCGSGSFYASAADLCRYEAALVGNRLVSAERMREATASGVDAGYNRTGYGFGWYIDDEWMSHAGSWAGFAAFIQRARQYPYSIYVMGNAEAPDPAEIAQAAAEIFA